MRNTLLTLLSFFIFSTVFAQTHQITYSFSIEGCDENYQVMAGEMLEGENMVFEEWNLPEGNSDTQFFYNLMVGGELGFPVGSLNEDINCDIFLAGLCDLDITNLPKEEDLLKLLYLTIKVTGENSGVHGDNEYYYLENGKESYLKLPLAKILGFLNYVQYSVDDFTPFFVSTNEKADYVGIRKVEEDQFISIYSKHFSTIGVGFKVQTPTDVNEIESTPTEFKLAQNYPNPFNPSTTISYTLKNAGHTKLTVFNSIGEEIQSFVNEIKAAGSHTVNFNASDLPSGMYFYTLTSGNFTQTNKMILMK